MLFLLPVRLVLTVSLPLTSKEVLNNLPICLEDASNLSPAVVVVCVSPLKLNFYVTVLIVNPHSTILNHSKTIKP